jgi:hypothetical protein
MAAIRGYIDDQDDALLLRLSAALGIDRTLSLQLTEFALLKHLPAPCNPL